MIVYFDASALVKRYVAEAGSGDVNALIERAAAVGTSVISRAEVSAALAKAARVGVLTRDEAGDALQVFTTEWENLIRLQITESIAARAANLVWEHGLRGYDAVHLATTLSWRDMAGEPIVMATYDKQLWHGAGNAGIIPWPETLSTA